MTLPTSSSSLFAGLACIGHSARKIASCRNGPVGRNAVKNAGMVTRSSYHTSFCARVRHTHPRTHAHARTCTHTHTHTHTHTRTHTQRTALARAGLVTTFSGVSLLMTTFFFSPLQRAITCTHTHRLTSAVLKPVLSTEASK